MTAILFIAILALAAVAARQTRRLSRLEALVAELRDPSTRPGGDGEREPPRAGEAVAAPSPPRRPAATVRGVRAPAIRPPEPTAPDRGPAAPASPRPAAVERPARDPIRIGFESLVGGRLPIWIGGAALVLAGFFLVRYSIESGLLGPAARTIIAGLFGIALIAGSEGARRLAATRADPRIGQALAGAGIASLYGTLYIAGAVYHLLGAPPAFAIMILVTLAGLGLALRHGPPTAIMALIGGFAAPIVAGFDPGRIGPLLVYLGLLVAALFGLAIRRGWIWLALAACGGGFAWTNLLIASASGDALGVVGGFVLLLAIGATMALPHTGTTRPWLRLLPLVAGLIQLLVLAPALDFGLLAWGFDLVLCAAALWLAARDEALVPGAAAALALVLALLATALAHDPGADARGAAIAITLLFGGVGHAFARRGTRWAGVALAATAGPVTLALALDHRAIAAPGWAALLTLGAIATASLSWRARDRAMANVAASTALTGGAALAMMLAMLALAEIVAGPWRWAAWLAVGVALAAWSRRTRDAGIGLLAVLPLAAATAAAAASPGRLAAYGASIVSAAPTPPAADLIAIGLLPAALLAATAWLLTPGRTRTALAWIALALALAFIPAALPAPWHAAGLGLAAALLVLARPVPPAAAGAAVIATVAFTLPLLVEMLVLAGTSVAGNRLPYRDLPAVAALLREITLPAALIAAACHARRPLPPHWRTVAAAMLTVAGAITLYGLAKAPLAIDDPMRFAAFGFAERVAITQIAFAGAWLTRQRWPAIARGLLILALARWAWFDLLILNPALVPQSVGRLPLLNLATLDAALAAAWLWPWRGERAWRRTMLAVTFVAVAATVRQATHGSLMTGAVGRTETWLYSAAFLALALTWLGRGIRSGSGELRVAGLILLTGVTLKVFLVDAAALEGVLRILSFLGLGLALIGIGWAYGRVAAPVQNRSTDPRSGDARPAS